MLNFVLDFLFPKTCGICNKICKESLCKKCELKLKQLEKIKLIEMKEKHFKKHLFLFSYEGIIRKKLIEYKFQDKPYLCEFFVKMIVNNEKICGILKSYDIIIPVPMYHKKESKRGYNQSSLIAEKLAQNYENLSYEKNCLIKIKNNEMQSGLQKTDRVKNVDGVYQVTNMKKIKDKKIILLDDIYTTGSTVNECSKMLKKVGTKEILVFTIAKD